MSVRTFPLCGAIALAAFIAPSVSANIVVNGSFEEPPISVAVIVVPHGGAFITGWTVTAPLAHQGIDLVNEIFWGHEYAYDGNQAIDLTGSPGPGAISQVLPTVSGTVYTLAFVVGSNSGVLTNGLTIFIDGVELDTVTTPATGTYDPRSYNFLAASSATEIKFSSNISGFGGPTLDAVSVVAVPGPMTLALLPAVALPVRRRRH